MPARQSGSPRQQCWSNFCIFVDSIDSQIILRMIRESKMNEGNCKHCSNQTRCSCVKRKSLVCNRPTCSTPVETDVQGYSEEHPKAAGICNECKVKPGKKPCGTVQKSINEFLGKKRPLPSQSSKHLEPATDQHKTKKRKAKVSQNACPDKQETKNKKVETTEKPGPPKSNRCPGGGGTSTSFVQGCVATGLEN